MSFNLNQTPACWIVTVPNNASFGGSTLTTLTVNGLQAYANGMIFQNTSSGAVTVELNKLPSAQFLLEGNSEITIPPGMMVITSFDFENISSSGDGGSSSKIVVIAGLAN